MKTWFHWASRNVYSFSKLDGQLYPRWEIVTLSTITNTCPFFLSLLFTLTKTSTRKCPCQRTSTLDHGAILFVNMHSRANIRGPQKDAKMLGLFQVELRVMFIGLISVKCGEPDSQWLEAYQKTDTNTYNNTFIEQVCWNLCQMPYALVLWNMYLRLSLQLSELNKSWQWNIRTHIHFLAINRVRVVLHCNKIIISKLQRQTLVRFGEFYTKSVSHINHFSKRIEGENSFSVTTRIISLRIYNYHYSNQDVTRVGK